MLRYLGDMAAAEAAYAKALHKGVDRLQAFLASPDHAPATSLSAHQTTTAEAEPPMALPGHSRDLCEAMAALCTAASSAAAEHGTYGVQNYKDAALRLRASLADYQAGSKGAIATVGSAVEVVRAAERNLDRARAAFEKARATEGVPGAPDPWLADLVRQRAADELTESLPQHEKRLQEACEEFNSCEHSCRKGFLAAIAESVAQARRVSEKVQISQQKAHVALQAIDLAHGDSDCHWLRSMADTAAADVQVACSMLQGCSANALESGDKVCSGTVARPGVKNLLWSKQYAVVTRAGFLHLFDAASASSESDGLPRLRSAPCTSLSLRDCTVSLTDYSPASRQVEVVAHSKLLPATRYTLKLENEDDVVEWACALNDHVPKDSVWAMKMQRAEDMKNEKFLQHRTSASHCGGC
eukprot:gnl/TRDRNA2_/TRDRNA2_35645_c0_seq1.p1 gnl/TRDRNA2_/TRDRNA2_35645_c0~~gnl/TRDRNA2_/TRDRNA2_35645_c0_seq1.p1  ORF type:complete len:448 (+),score=86.07 gnl/TRDRNA2_/TRDRNA2_35645_c0_seq1:107-1345(+)